MVYEGPTAEQRAAWVADDRARLGEEEVNRRVWSFYDLIMRLALEQGYRWDRELQRWWTPGGELVPLPG